MIDTVVHIAFDASPPSRFCCSLFRRAVSKYAAPWQGALPRQSRDAFVLGFPEESPPETQSILDDPDGFSAPPMVSAY